jgi:hypothetical protein
MDSSQIVKQVLTPFIQGDESTKFRIATFNGEKQAMSIGKYHYILGYRDSPFNEHRADDKQRYEYVIIRNGELFKSFGKEWGLEIKLSNYVN